MRRSIGLLLATTLMIVGLAAVPAAADPPTLDSFPVTFRATNPCSGLDHDITINLEFRDHVGHKNNFVGHLSRTGTTSDGYVMNHGVENFVENGNVARGAFTDQWRHPDGSKFKAQGGFVFNKISGELVVNRFSLTCIGN